MHYTEQTRPSQPIQHMPGQTVSTSFHGLAQLQQEYGDLDYAFLSPIFNSISKEGYQQAFDLETLSEHVKASKYPLVALGGIHTGTQHPELGCCLCKPLGLPTCAEALRT